MPDELGLYGLEHPEVEKVFNQSSFEENDSSTVGYQLEVKSQNKRFQFVWVLVHETVAEWKIQKFNILHQSCFNSRFS